MTQNVQPLISNLEPKGYPFIGSVIQQQCFLPPGRCAPPGLQTHQRSWTHPWATRQAFVSASAVQSTYVRQAQGSASVPLPGSMLLLCSWKLVDKFGLTARRGACSCRGNLLALVEEICGGPLAIRVQQRFPGGTNLTGADRASQSYRGKPFANMNFLILSRQGWFQTTLVASPHLPRARDSTCGNKRRQLPTLSRHLSRWQMGAHCISRHDGPSKLMWHRATRVLSMRTSLPTCNRLCGKAACAPRRHLQKLSTFTSAACSKFSNTCSAVGIDSLLSRVDLQGTKSHRSTRVNSISDGSSIAMASADELPEIPMEVCFRSSLVLCCIPHLPRSPHLIAV